ncbi:MAG TPA: zinc ABC transporter substrate-binding protein [bacterium]|nr:zinc ABC transporter substrate-binding protein [bacterium]
MTHRISRRTLLTGAAGLGAIVLAGRAGGARWAARAAAAPAKIPVVAAENFYGDVVGQIAGDRVLLTSIISDPNVDPHEYESSMRDMAAIGRARLVIINGLGYDGFMPKLIKAAPNPQREVKDVAHLVGKKEGDNWHIWYDPTVVPKFARAVTDFFVRVDAANAKSYHNRLLLFEASYKPFTDRVASLRARLPGTAVGATEPIFGNLADALDWKVITPMAFQKAVEEGEDPPARAIAEMQDQIRKHAIKVLIYNVQTVSPVTERIRKDAGRLGVPVVGVSETLPPGLSYQRWMLKQLDEIERAVAKK